MIADRQAIRFEHPPEVVFAFITDPYAWQLAGPGSPGVEELQQRPIRVGTTWRYQRRPYACRELAFPSRFTVATNRDVVVFTLEGDGARSTLCTVEASRDRGSPGAPQSNPAFRVHWSLLAELKKLLEGTVGGPYLHRVSSTYELRKDVRWPAISITTRADIEAAREAVFDTIVGDPAGFWRWMVDRSDPGGLTVSPEWPSAGAQYSFKRKPAARASTLFRRWDSGTVRVLEIEPPSRAVLEERQNEVRAVIRSTYELGDLRGAGGRGRTGLTSHYLVSIEHWLLRRAFPTAILRAQAGVMVRQTANIVAVCDAGDPGRPGEP